MAIKRPSHQYRRERCLQDTWYLYLLFVCNNLVDVLRHSTKAAQPNSYVGAREGKECQKLSHGTTLVKQQHLTCSCLSGKNPSRVDTTKQIKDPCSYMTSREDTLLRAFTIWTFVLNKKKATRSHTLGMCARQNTQEVWPHASKNNVRTLDEEG